MTSKKAHDDRKKERFRKLIKRGAEFGGAAASGAIGGYLSGDPAAAILLSLGNAAISATVQRIGGELSDRFLGPREQSRVGYMLIATAEQIHKRLDSGDTVRDDGFFDEEDVIQSDGDAVFEDVLLKSQKEPEQKKLLHMSYLFSEVAFNAEISAQLAHQMLKVTDQLTYRQLCILKLAVVKENFPLRTDDYRGQSGGFTRDLYQILYECLYLYQLGLINFGGEVAFGPTDVKPKSMTVQGIGADIYNFMKLQLIPDHEIDPVVRVLL